MTEYFKSHAKVQGFDPRSTHATAKIPKKETGLKRPKFDEDFTLQKTHMIGKVVHNLDKVNRALQKTNYNERNSKPTEQE